jgi:hypothetical protein
VEADLAVEAVASTAAVDPAVVVDPAAAVDPTVAGTGKGLRAWKCFNGWRLAAQHCAASCFSLLLLRLAKGQDDNGKYVTNFLRVRCVSALRLPYPAYIPITRSSARRHTAQNLLCRVNIMQSTSGR